MKKFFISTFVEGNVGKIIAVVGIVTITFVLLSFVSNSEEKDGNEKFLTMKVVEINSGPLGSFIMIVDENGKEETIELEKLAGKKTSFVNNVVIINNTLNKIGDKGYKLVSQSSAGDQYCILTIYTFVKQ